MLFSEQPWCVFFRCLSYLDVAGIHHQFHHRLISYFRENFVRIDVTYFINDSCFKIAVSNLSKGSIEFDITLTTGVLPYKLWYKL